METSGIEDEFNLSEGMPRLIYIKQPAKDSENRVTFWYKDYKDGGKRKLMTLSGEEFLRRFAQHILPPRFVRIRHYGSV